MCVDSYVIQLVTRLPILNMVKLLILISFVLIVTGLAFENNVALFLYHVKPRWEKVRLLFQLCKHSINDLFSRMLF